MSETLLQTSEMERKAAIAARLPARPRPEAGAAARGIMLALAISSIGWIGIALLVPRLW